MKIIIYLFLATCQINAVFSQWPNFSWPENVADSVNVDTVYSKYPDLIPDIICDQYFLAGKKIAEFMYYLDGTIYSLYYHTKNFEMYISYADSGFGINLLQFKHPLDERGLNLEFDGAMNVQRVSEFGYPLHGKVFLYNTSFDPPYLQYVSDYANGVVNGRELEYYPNGNLWIESTLINGKSEGCSYTYYENGVISSITSWKNNQILSSTKFDENGRLKYYSIYKDGEFVKNVFIEDE